MSVFSISGIRVSGVSACVPKQPFHNKDYDWLNEKERSNLIKTIGVESKRHVRRGVTSADLCFAAADKLLDELEWKRDEIDLLIFVSQTRDYLMPATACILQERLGLSDDCMAFDLDLGCSGYVYGLSVINSMLNAAHLKKALLLTGEIPSPNISYKDKSTFPLFGDAGAATALEYNPEKASQAFFNLQTSGKGYRAIHIPDGGMRNFPTADSFKEEEISEGIIRNRFQIALDGMAVFNFTITRVRPNIEELLKHYNIPKQEIDYFVFHQANKLLNETIRKQLKVDAEKYPYSINHFGNTSSASIPLTIVTAIRDEIRQKHLRLLLSGFGVGLSWGSCILDTDRIVCPDLIEID